jgi:hypothetical protein
MADFDLQGLFGGINTALTSPGALAGLGLLSGEGMSGAAQGIQAGTQAIQARELQRQAAIKQQRDQAWQNQFANGQAPEWAKGLPPSLVQTAVLAGPDQGTQLLGQGIMHKGDLDAQLKQASAMANLEFQNQMRLLKAQQALKLQNYQSFMGGGGAPAPSAPQQAPMQSAPALPTAGAPSNATGNGMSVPNLFSQGAAPAPAQQSAPVQPQPSGGISAPMDPRRVAAGVAAGLIPPEAGKMMIDGDEQSKVRSRAQVAGQLGMDPEDPATKQYLLTGQIPKMERNYPAINKADEATANIDNSIDTADDALRLNKNAYSGFAPETRAWLGGMVGLQGAKDTQQYQYDAKLLSQELAKSLSAGRVNQFEQKLMSDLQGGLSQPPEVREKILQTARGHLQRKRDLAAKQAEELRNGTYYAPRSFGTNAPTTGTNSLPDPLGIR